MAHAQQRAFIERVVHSHPRHFESSTVVEIGSLNINGTVRDYFVDPVQYVGVDLAEGACVDMVCDGQDVDLPSDSCDVAISTECFEHNPNWRETFLNMVRMTRPGGLVIFTCATTGRAEHGTARTTPHDSPFTVAQGWTYYRNLTADDFLDLGLTDLFRQYEFDVNAASHDLYFYGIKADA